MKKILGKLLALILAVVVACCGIIVLCSISPDAVQEASYVSQLLKSYIDKKKAEKEAEDAGNPAVSKADQSNTESSADSLTAESSEELAEGESTEGNDSATDTNTEKKATKPFDEYANSYSNSGLVSGLTDNSASNSSADTAESDESLLAANNDKIDSYSLPEKTVVNLETAQDLQDALKDTSMGSIGNDLTFDKNYYPYYYMLDDDCKQLYKQIYASTIDLKTTFIPVVRNATSDEWFNALTSVIYDHPELFWLDTKMYTEYDYSGKVVKVKLHFFDELTDIKAAQAEFDAKTESVLALAKELDSDFKKEVFIHNYLTDKLSYKEGNLDQSAYSAIVQDETVCAGYAKAFQFLMQQLDVPTYFTVGWGGTKTSGGLHGWDVVKLDKDYYNVDVTWDDATPRVYDYFNKADKDFSLHTRMFNSKYLPNCNGKKYQKVEDLLLVQR